MKLRAIACAVALGMLTAGCVGLAPSAPAAAQNAAQSAAGAQRLMYVLDETYDLLDVLSYPQMKRRQRIGEMFELGQMCTDGQHIWMPGAFANEIVEYNVGGSEPIAVLEDPGYTPDGCAYDKTTGNLAVTNFFYKTGTAGNLLIYPNASGSPNSYSCNLYYYLYVTYDDSGNLYLDGADESGSSGFCEMQKRGSLTPVDVGKYFESAGGMLWDGKYVAVGDPKQKTIYRFAFSGGGVSKRKATIMAGNGDCALFWIEGGTLVCPDAEAGVIEYYRYPQGGKPVRTYTKLAKPGQAIIVTK